MPHSCSLSQSLQVWAAPVRIKSMFPGTFDCYDFQRQAGWRDAMLCFVLLVFVLVSDRNWLQLYWHRVELFETLWNSLWKSKNGFVVFKTPPDLCQHSCESSAFCKQSIWSYAKSPVISSSNVTNWSSCLKHLTPFESVTVPASHTGPRQN